MVNKFGDDTSQGFGLRAQAVKKVTLTKGKYGDYCTQIISTYRLGFTPHRLTSGRLATPVYTVAHRVFSHGSVCSGDGSFQHRIDTTDAHIGQVCATEVITDKIVSKDDSLVIFKEITDDDDDDDNMRIMAIQGEEGPIGPQGPPGPQGAQGPPTDYGYVGIVVAKMLPSQFKPDTIVKNLRDLK